MEEKEELKQLLENFYRISKVKYLLLIIFAAIVLTITYTDLYQIRKEIVWLIFFLAPSAFFFETLLKKTRLKETVRRVSIVTIISMTVELTVVLLCFYLDGTLLLVGLFGVTLYLLIPYFTLTRQSYRWTFIIIAIIISVFLVTLNHLISANWNNIQDFVVFPPGDAPQVGIENVSSYRGLYLLNMSLGLTMMLVIILLVDVFARRLHKSIKLLSNKEKELQGVKDILEVKVKTRTRELESERASLEEKVEGRTKELQERVGELERFHSLTVGREIKMIELKKEIERLKKEKPST